MSRAAAPSRHPSSSRRGWLAHQKCGPPAALRGSEADPTGLQGILSIWDVQQGSLVRTLEGHSGFIWGIDWSAEYNILMSAGADGIICW
jgi:WD40 repeat protein